MLVGPFQTGLFCDSVRSPLLASCAGPGGDGNAAGETAQLFLSLTLLLPILLWCAPNLGEKSLSCNWRCGCGEVEAEPFYCLEMHGECHLFCSYILLSPVLLFNGSVYTFPHENRN